MNVGHFMIAHPHSFVSLVIFVFRLFFFVDDRPNVSADTHLGLGSIGIPANQIQDLRKAIIIRGYRSCPIFAQHSRIGNVFLNVGATQGKEYRVAVGAGEQYAAYSFHSRTLFAAKEYQFLDICKTGHTPGVAPF